MDAEKPQPTYESVTDLASNSAAQSKTAIKDTPQNSAQSFNHWPSDEQPQLASQAEDMANLLKSDSIDSALSVRLQKFAKDVGMLEERLSKYQAIIQRQHVQIQHLSEASNQRLIAQLREQIRNLKQENETLQTLIKANAQRQQLQPAVKTGELEPGWVTVGSALENNTETMSMMLYPDSPLMKRIDELQIINAKLFKANKDWHLKWEQLRQSKQDEKEELASRLKAAEENNERLKSEVLSLQNKAKDEKEKDVNSRQKEKDAQIGLLKQQLTVFMQDFEKERKEKTLCQEKLLRKEKEFEKLKLEQDQKVKSLVAEVRLKEDKIKANTKELNRLQFRVVELMDEVKEEKRRANTAAASRLPTQSFVTQHQGSSPTGMTSLVYPSGAGAPPLSTLYSSQFAIGHRRGPEELPGAWTCPDCTYINYPDRTVCDICGLTKTLDGHISFSEIGELQSRGSSPSLGVNVPDNCADVEIDAT
ncbi:hypothetical protein ElyMa_006319400 [Elysia marginata]|uniref:RanBP2-type domain-containing protein n=1 Tax=Elysia marginata TaxID=1093978 RepID=A0AAV4HI41_9GAST|nr:hypothetical protein ElyMa_006319400 [Elysia marginata]